MISIGAMISFFALAMSCLNAGARVLFTMGRYGIFPISDRQLAQAQPHAARGDLGVRGDTVPDPDDLHSLVVCRGRRVADGAVRRIQRRRTVRRDGLLRSVRADLAGHAVLSEEDRRAEGPPHRDRGHCSGSVGRADCRHGLSGAVVPAELFPVYFRRLHRGRCRAGFDSQPQHYGNRRHPQGARRNHDGAGCQRWRRHAMVAEAQLGRLRSHGGAHDDDHTRFAGESPPLSGEVHDGRGPQRRAHHAARTFRRPRLRTVRHGNRKSGQRQEPAEVAEPVQLSRGLHQSSGSRDRPCLRCA